MSRPMNHLALLATGLVAALTVAACSSNPGDLDGLGGSGDDTQGGGGNTSPAAACAASTVTYTGFDGADLAGSRVQAVAGADHVRLKPYPLLYGDFERVLGPMPATAKAQFDGAASSFDAARPRYLVEPKATGVGMTSWFDVSFGMANVYVTANAAKYGAMPTPDTAKDFCTTFAKSAWRRDATPDEITSCVDLATTKLGMEPSAARRWTYVLASLLSTADFLGY